MELLSEFNSLPKGIFHCFSGNTAQAKQILNSTPFKLGIGGVVTFKNSGLDKVVEDIDLKHLVLETDAPYLAPVPFRGKRNEPVYLLEVAKKVAEIKNCSMLELAEITSKNANEVFNTTTTSIHQINKHELS
jgi:TatD DNase family protein